MAVFKQDFFSMIKIVKENLTILENPIISTDTTILPRCVKNIREIIILFENWAQFKAVINTDRVEGDDIAPMSGPEDLRDDWPHAIVERLEAAQKEKYNKSLGPTDGSLNTMHGTEFNEDWDKL